MSYPKEFNFTLDNPGDYERGAWIDETIVDGSDEYWERLRAGLPIRWPRLKVGDIVHNPSHQRGTIGSLAPVVRVAWYNGRPCFNSGWEASVPGYSNAAMFATAEEGATHYYVQTQSDTWAVAHRLEVYQGRLASVERVTLYVPTTDDPDRPWQRGRRVTTLTPPIYPAP